MSEKIRILMVVGRMDRGGIETMMMDTYRIIDREKIQFDFVMHTTDRTHYQEEIESLGGRIYSIPAYTVKNHAEYVRAWNRFFREHHEYKTVHGHMRSTASIYLPIAKKYGCTTISHSHSTSSGHGIGALVKDILQKGIRADYYLACSLPAGQWLFGNKRCTMPNFKVVPNGIDTKKFAFTEEKRERIRTELGLHGKFAVGNVSRLIKAKNHLFMLDIIKQLKVLLPNAVLVLVGDGEEREAIQAKIKELDIENDVIMTGVRQDIADILCAFDVFLFPSVFEGFGNAVTEAQASGLRCIVSDAVPSEVRITPLVEFCPINEGADVWVSKIKNAKSEDRAKYSAQTAESGYDVTSIAEWYTEFYTRCHGERLDISGKNIKAINS